jgi:hypothetical protein
VSAVSAVENGASFTITEEAGAAVKSGIAVAYDQDGTVIPADGVQAVGVMVSREDEASGEFVPLTILGIARAKADGTSAIAKGDALVPSGTSGSEGVLIKRTNEAFVFATALEALAAGAADIKVRVHPSILTVPPAG